MIKKIGLVIVPMLALGGCATYTGWQPVVDPYNDRNPAMIQQDTEACRAIASESGSTGTEALKGGAAGALIGGAAGAAIGAVTGKPGTGAAIGAAAGGIGGAAYQGSDGDAQYKRAFINCMRARGHNVVN
jgi:outer membrane lipoprotein SlyB